MQAKTSSYASFRLSLLPLLVERNIIHTRQSQFRSETGVKSKASEALTVGVCCVSSARVHKDSVACWDGLTLVPRALFEKPTNLPPRTLPAAIATHDLDATTLAITLPVPSHTSLTAVTRYPTNQHHHHNRTQRWTTSNPSKNAYPPPNRSPPSNRSNTPPSATPHYRASPSSANEYASAATARSPSRCTWSSSSLV